MSARKGKGVSSLMTLTKSRREEKEAPAPEKQVRKKLLDSYKSNTLPALQQRIAEIIFDTIPEGEEGYINMKQYMEGEGITRPSFVNAFRCLVELGHIEVLPPLRPGIETRIRVIKTYTPKLSPEHMKVYTTVKGNIKRSKPTKFSLLDLAVATHIRPKRLFSRLRQLERRGFIKVTVDAEDSNAVTVSLTGLSPKEEGANKSE